MTPYKAGRMAAQQGEPRTANPHFRPVEQKGRWKTPWGLWDHGWQEADEEMDEAADTDWSKV